MQKFDCDLKFSQKMLFVSQKFEIDQNPGIEF